MQLDEDLRELRSQVSDVVERARDQNPGNVFAPWLVGVALAGIAIDLLCMIVQELRRLHAAPARRGSKQ